MNLFTPLKFVTRLRSRHEHRVSVRKLERLLFAIEMAESVEQRQRAERSLAKAMVRDAGIRERYREHCRLEHALRGLGRSGGFSEGLG